MLFGNWGAEPWGRWGWVREGKADSQSRKQIAVLDAGTGIAGGDIEMVPALSGSLTRLVSWRLRISESVSLRTFSGYICWCLTFKTKSNFLCHHGHSRIIRDKTSTCLLSARVVER